MRQGQRALRARFRLFTFAREALLPGLLVAGALLGCGPGALPSSLPPPIAATPEELAPVEGAAHVEEPPHEAPHTARGPSEPSRFAVAGENESGVLAARFILEKGGSATDAAIVGTLVGCAAHPSSCGLGGGGEALVFDARTQAVTAFDFRETAPAALRRAETLSKRPAPKKRGVMIGVPGLIAGLELMHQKGGRLPWKVLLEEAAAHVERGLPLSPFAAQTFVWDETTAPDLPYLPKGADRRVGELIQNPELVKTLRAIAEGGSAAFYRGPIANDVVKAAKDAGGRLARGDLQKYRALTRPALSIPFGDRRIWGAPPPSAGGFQVLSVLSMKTPEGFSGLWSNRGDFLHGLAEGLRLSYAERAQRIGDPAFTKAAGDPLIDPAFWSARGARLNLKETTLPKVPSISDGGTYVTVVFDDEGNAVVLTASLTHMFGSSAFARGFALNDALSDFATDEYGIRAVTRGPNFARAEARPSGNHSPTLVVEAGRCVLGLGGSGGLRGPTGVLWVLLSTLTRKTPIDEAIAEPRMHVTPLGALWIEPEWADLQADLEGRGENVIPKTLSFSAVTAIAQTFEGDRRFYRPAVDPRRGGATAIGTEPPALAPQ